MNEPLITIALMHTQVKTKQMQSFRSGMPMPSSMLSASLMMSLRKYKVADD